MSASPVTLVGNLTADPELKFMPTGVGKLTFGIAVNHFWTDQDGETTDDAANVLTKGVRVVVTGRLEQRSWDDKETGTKRSTIEVLADNIGLNVGNIDSFVRKQKAEGQTPTYTVKPRNTQTSSTRPQPMAQVQLEEEEAW